MTEEEREPSTSARDGMVFGPGVESVVVSVRIAGREEVARLSFYMDEDDGWAQAHSVEVYAPFQRKGVASWLYRAAEEHYDVGLYHSEDLSDDGKAFKKGRRNPTPDLMLREGKTITNGIYIASGNEVTLPVLHSTEPAPDMGTKYDQHVEPKGLWVIERDPGYKHQEGSMWTSGEIRLKSPLVIEFVATKGPRGWKRRLSEAMAGRKGASLSRWLLKSGYDGVITVTDHDGRLDTREIVDLDPQWNPRNNPGDDIAKRAAEWCMKEYRRRSKLIIAGKASMGQMIDWVTPDTRVLWSETMAANPELDRFDHREEFQRHYDKYKAERRRLDRAVRNRP